MQLVDQPDARIVKCDGHISDPDTQKHRELVFKTNGSTISFPESTCTPSEVRGKIFCGLIRQSDTEKHLRLYCKGQWTVFFISLVEIQESATAILIVNTTEDIT